MRLDAVRDVVQTGPCGAGTGGICRFAEFEGGFNLSEKHSFWRRRVLATAVAMAALSLAGGAHAQSKSPIQLAERPGAPELQEVLVTARKREESILNVPV